MSDPIDVYAPTQFQESNAILLAGMYLHDDDDLALTKLEELLRDMAPGEVGRLAAAARELHHVARAAEHVMRREEASSNG